jgi:hypothetical protein
MPIFTNRVQYTDMEEQYSSEQVSEGRVAKIRRSTWNTILKYGDQLLDKFEYDWSIIKYHNDLFFGVLLFLLGLLNFHSGRYCDGNTADYLSCTRPVTYYYYTWFDMILIILGITFILLWFMKREHKQVRG